MTLDLIAHLSHLSLITLSGEKAQAFLQGQLTCDVRNISETQSHIGAHCSAKGRVLATLRVVKYQDHFHLLLPTSMVEPVSHHLQKYAALSRITLERNTQIIALGFYGAKLEHELAAELGELPKGPDQTLTKNDVLLIRTRGTQPRFEMLGTQASLQELLIKLRQDYPLVEHEAWRLLDIKAGIPTIYPATMDLFTPHMLNYPALNGISFKKGCYVGQEVIARTEYLGKVKRHLLPATLHCEILPQPGEVLLNDQQQEVGVIIDAVFNSPNSCQMLAVLQDEAQKQTVYWQKDLIHALEFNID